MQFGSKVESPVFIIGQARSGTSILYRALQYHPSFLPRNCPYGPNVTESKAFIRCTFNEQNAPYNPAVQYMLDDREQYVFFAHSVRFLKLWQSLFGYNRKNPAQVYSYLLNRTMRWKLSLSFVIMRRYFARAQSIRGCRRVLEKTPAHVKRIPEIKATFHDAKFLMMIRHPIDVFSSYKRRLATEKKRGASSGLSWMEIDVATFCAMYEHEAEIIINAAKKDATHALIVRYEEFTTNPQIVLQQILEFLQEPFDDACIVKDESDKLSWTPDPHLYRNIEPSTKKWHKYISIQEGILIETRLATLIERLAYTFYTAQVRNQHAKHVQESF